MEEDKRITNRNNKGWENGEPTRIKPKINWFIKNPFDGNVYQESLRHESMFVCSINDINLAKLITLFPQAYMLAKSISFGEMPTPEHFKQMVSDFEEQKRRIIAHIPKEAAEEISGHCTQDWIDSDSSYWSLFESATHITDKLGLEDDNDKMSNKKSTNFIDS